MASSTAAGVALVALSWPAASRQRRRRFVVALGVPLLSLALSLFWAGDARLCTVVVPSSPLAGVSGARGQAASFFPGAARRGRRWYRTLRHAQDSEAGAAAAAEQDWRDFRAKLVKQELGGEEVDGGETDEGERGAKTETSDGWAYATPLIEQGSILLSAPSDHFAINQQYFHKNVIFLVEHTKEFTRGVILNRPTAFSASDLEELAVQKFTREGVDDWNVWCGGDCAGVNARGDAEAPVFSLMHGLDRLAEQSQQIIRGVFSIDIDVAKTLVASGEADKDDFLLVVGYCGWGPGQLQDELDRGGTWTMAAADQRTLLGELRDAQAALRKRIAGSAEGQVFDATDVGDGISTWERLYAALGPDFQKNLEEFKATGDSAHTDEMLRRWVTRCLIPSRYRPAQPLNTGPDVRPGRGRGLKGGTILWSSPSAWLLGKPTEDPMFDMRRFLPSQYLHKAVLLVLKDVEENEASLVALINGPLIARLGAPSSAGDDLFWGGPQPTGEMNIKGGGGTIRVKGLTALLPGTLEYLIKIGAFTVANDVDLEEMVDLPVAERWAAAGGTIDTIAEAQSAQLGDVQRQKWYKKFLDLDVIDPE